MKFSDKDIQQIENNALTVEKVNAQITLIKTGMLYSNLQKVATIGSGIFKLDEKEEQNYINVYENKCNSLSIVKFVPASGAATRMFKFLFQFLKDYNIDKESIVSYSHKYKDISVFFEGLEKLPFFEEVVHKTHKIIPNFNDLSYDERCVQLAKTILDEDRLNYSFYPKGLLPFHKYKDHVSTAFEEHLFEAALYASSNNEANLHFTISEKHSGKFEEELSHIKEGLEDKTNTKFNISFSYQKQSTETIALTSNNELYREADKRLLFRPSGHGALIENLNDLDFDLVFIKNIDNVVVREASKKMAYCKKMLAGILLDIQEKGFKFLHQLEKEALTDDECNIITSFLSEKMNVILLPEFKNYTNKAQIEYLKEKLNRPIRVCGMVKNVGETGGGPFWVKDESGNVSLQIVESAQLDAKNKQQIELLKNATHFNPVDLVCGIKNYKGETFDLTKFVDYKAAFITIKSQNGVDIKALELPGLWNGSMAYWNTIFVEVPLMTFNPVKTVNDLLKGPHQGS